MKPSSEPLFWALFGAGGTLAALLGPALIFLTGIAAPLGILLPRRAMDYTRVMAFAQNPIGKVALLAVISLFLFHGCHRMVHSLHDLGMRTGQTARIMFYGFATIATIATATLLVGMGA